MLSDAKRRDGENDRQHGSRQGWEIIRAQMLRAAATGVARAAYHPIRTLFQVAGRATLGRCETPAALLGCLTDPATPRGRRGDGLAALIVIARDRGPSAPVASTLLWLALWPALTQLRREAAALHPRVRDEELTSEVAASFTDAIALVDVGDVDSLEAWLLLKTATFLLEALRPEAMHPVLHLDDQHGPRARRGREPWATDGVTAFGWGAMEAELAAGELAYA